MSAASNLASQRDNCAPVPQEREPAALNSRKLKVLIGCEESGVVRRAFRKLGHDAWSCDLRPARDGSPRHYQRDVREVWGLNWDLIILHPVCRRLANSGVRWLHERPGYWADMEEGASFFRECLDAPAEHVAVENSVMHGHALERIGRRHDQTTQPWMFGDDFKKRSCWWLRNLPRLKRTSNLDGSTAYPKVHRMPPGPDREKLRSETEPGIAAAMAEQWGGYVAGLKQRAILADQSSRKLAGRPA